MLLFLSVSRSAISLAFPCLYNQNATCYFLSFSLILLVSCSDGYFAAWFPVCPPNPLPVQSFGTAKYQTLAWTCSVFSEGCKSVADVLQEEDPVSITAVSRYSWETPGPKREDRCCLLLQRHFINEWLASISSLLAGVNFLEN